MAKRAFDRALEAALAPLGLVGWCEACGDLYAGAPVVALGDPHVRCTACGLTLGRDGRAVGQRLHDGDVGVVVVYLPALHAPEVP